MEPSGAIEERIRKEAAKLERYSDRITGCRVVVEEPQRRHHHGNLFHIRIDLTLPGGELLVKRSPAEHHAHEDAYVAIRDAFMAARRRLQDHVRRQRRDIKVHEEQPEGRIIRLVPGADHGFIEAGDGHEVYFHRNSVLGGAFGALEIGNKVRFVEEEGENGPQASTVIRNS
jgi:cold shock CspA family protein/ribosome-associated translation inhibitor RaiA